MDKLPKSLEKFIKDRDEALLNLNIKWIMNNTNCKDENVAIVTAHKARYEATSLPPEKRHESRKWLEDRGYKRLTGTDFLPDGELPE